MAGLLGTQVLLGVAEMQSAISSPKAGASSLPVKHKPQQINYVEVSPTHVILLHFSLL